MKNICNECNNPFFAPSPIKQEDWCECDKMQNYPINDNRPLTDETLKELGFKYIDDNYAYSINGIWLVGYKSKEGRNVKFKNYSFPIYKTVGSVKMLIEALKGDE